MRFLRMLLCFIAIVCPVCAVNTAYADVSHISKLNKNILVIKTDSFEITFDKKHNFIITGLAFGGQRNLVKDLQVVADVEGGKDKDCLESYAKTLSYKIKKLNDRCIITVHWRSKYFDVTKTITVFKKYRVVCVHYDFYIIRKPYLRVLAAPLIDLSDNFKSVSYVDRAWKTHRCSVSELTSQPFGKFSCKRPGIAYAAGNGKTGLLIIVPKLMSEYGSFAWPPEFGRARQLVRNYNVGKVGIFFPHKLAFGSPDTRFSATVVLSVYENGSIKATIDKIAKLIKIEKPVFKPVPKNVSARYKGCFAGVNVWIDYQSGVHRRGEEIGKARKIEKAFELCAAKNQFVSFQIYVNPASDIRLKKVLIGGLSFDSEIRLCRYIKLTEPSRIFPERDVKGYPSYWPDPLVRFKPMMLKENQNQGIWITIYVPSSARVGIYNGKVILEFEQAEIPIDFRLRVFDFSLPTPRTFKNITDVYGEMIKNGRGQNPRRYVDAYSSKIEELHADLFARYNLSVISYYERPFNIDVIKKYWRRCSVVNLPGSEAMIIFEGIYWPKYVKGKKYNRGDGDYFRAAVDTFRKRIDYYRRAGVSGKIYAIVTDDALYRKNFREFLLRFVPAVKKLDDKLMIVGCVKSSFDDELAKLFDVVITGVDLSDDVERSLDRAMKTGKISARWAVLNQWTAIDANPIELRSVFRKLFFKGITGSWNWDGLWFWFLTNDVYNQPKLNNWWGEGYLVYPPGDDPVPSIRLAQIRTGIDDYEYLTILRKLGDKKICRRFEQLGNISSVDNVSAIEFEKYRLAIGEMIERLKKGNRK